jgi:predicted nuclease of predicted toxin-antitoxin system
MKFLIDAQLPPALCAWLQLRDHEAVHVVEIGMGGASDKLIAGHAIAENLMLISKDEDFVYLRHPDRFALMWLRCGNATNRSLTEWLDHRWDRVETLLAAGERFIEFR